MTNTTQGEIDRDDDSLWMEVVARRRGSAQSIFVYAVTSTKIYCRPGCPSRLPSRRNVRFYQSPDRAESAGYRPCLRCKPREESESNAVVVRVCGYIENHLDNDLALDSLSEVAGLSPTHLQKVFRRIIGLSPREYANSLRITKFKDRLKDGEGVTSAMIDAGYGSSRGLYEKSAASLGMKPSDYKRGGKSMDISFAAAESHLGWLLVASTERGICAVSLGDNLDELETRLRTEFSAARISRDNQALETLLLAMLEHINGLGPDVLLPLDIQATAFQRLVWQHLQTIPYGRTETYSQVAEAIGKPTAVRAVANACAANHIALAIPCHRVVRSDGGLGGYRWGKERKAVLLRREKSHS